MRICADGLVHCSTLHWDSQNHRHDGLHVPRYVLSIRDGYIDLTSTNKDPLFSSPRAKRFQYLFAIVAVDGHAIQMAAQQDPSSAHVRLEVSAEDLQAVEKTVNDFIEEILRHTGIPFLECSTCGTDLKRVRDIARHPTVAIVMCRPCLAWWHLENDLAPVNDPLPPLPVILCYCGSVLTRALCVSAENREKMFFVHGNRRKGRIHLHELQNM